jgi:hypothetical protein
MFLKINVKILKDVHINILCISSIFCISLALKYDRIFFYSHSSDYEEFNLKLLSSGQKKGEAGCISFLLTVGTVPSDCMPLLPRRF